MIISASRRTDIPAHYSDWLVRRLGAGFCLAPNPMNRAQVRYIQLSPDVVECIVFWTKDPGPMLPVLPQLDEMGYRYYFQFTVTPYGKELEQNLRDKQEIEDCFLRLSERLGAERVVWRYDPIVVDGEHSANYHKEQFERLCERFCGACDSVVISFVDRYARRANALREVTAAQMRELAAFIGRTAPEYGFAPSACCEAGDFSGIRRASCIDRARIEKICGYRLKVNGDKNQRAGCGCCESVDIGMYDTCPNGCVYCYAGRSQETAARNRALHDPRGEMLLGKLREGDKVIQRPAASDRQEQIKFEI